MPDNRSPAIWLSAEVASELRAAEETHLPVLARLALNITDCGKGDPSLLQRLLHDLREAALALQLDWRAQGWLGAVTGRRLAERRQLASASRTFLSIVEAVRAEAEAFARYSAHFEAACTSVLPEYNVHRLRLERKLAETVPQLRQVFQDLRRKGASDSPHVQTAMQRLLAQAEAVSDRLARQLHAGTHARRLPVVAEDMRQCHEELEGQLQGLVTSRGARILQHVSDALVADRAAAAHSLAAAGRVRQELLESVEAMLAALARLAQRQHALVEAFSGLARRMAEIQPSAASSRVEQGEPASLPS